MRATCLAMAADSLELRATPGTRQVERTETTKIQTGPGLAAGFVGIRDYSAPEHGWDLAVLATTLFTYGITDLAEFWATFQNLLSGRFNASLPHVLARAAPLAFATTSKSLFNGVVANVQTGQILHVTGTVEGELTGDLRTLGPRDSEDVVLGFAPTGPNLVANASLAEVRDHCVGIVDLARRTAPLLLGHRTVGGPIRWLVAERDAGHSQGVFD